MLVKLLESGSGGEVHVFRWQMLKTSCVLDLRVYATQRHTDIIFKIAYCSQSVSELHLSQEHHTANRDISVLLGMQLSTRLI